MRKATIRMGGEQRIQFKIYPDGREEEEEKEKSMSVFGWDLFVCIARAEDTFETAVSWSCSVVRSCDAFTAASQSAVCGSSFMLFDFFFGGMLPKRQRIAQT